MPKRDPDIIALLIKAVAAKRPVDVYGLAAILASDENREVILAALEFYAFATTRAGAERKLKAGIFDEPDEESK